MEKARDIHTVDHDLAREAEEQRDRVSRGKDGAHKPEEKFPGEEAKEEADESVEVSRRPHGGQHR